MWQNLLKEITTDKAWSWANNENNKGAMQIEMDLFNASIEAFGGQWLSTEPAKMKKLFSPAVLETSLTRFNELKADAKDVIDKLDDLREQHHTKMMRLNSRKAKGGDKTTKPKP